MKEILGNIIAVIFFIVLIAVILGPVGIVGGLLTLFNIVFLIIGCIILAFLGWIIEKLK